MNEIAILLVEDDADDLELMLHALRKANIINRVQVARDGAEALDYVFGQGDFAEGGHESQLKVIILDLKLPKVDGMEVLRRIKKDPRTQNIPVVILTSSQEQRDAVESHKLGVNSYAVKPMRLEHLVNAVQQMGLYWLSLNQSPTLEEHGSPSKTIPDQE